MQLDLYIAELLKDHDCVIVPDFGGFVANYAPAKINATNHRFDPPHRKISYNKYLVHNDGLLASYVAQKEALEYDAALRNVKAYTLYLKEELQAKKQVSIEKVGVLYQQSNGTFRFEQIKNPEFFKDGFGLESFFAKELKPAETKVEKPATVASEPKVIAIKAEVAEQEEPEVSESKKRRSVWPMVAAAAALPIVGYTIWLSMSTPLFNPDAKFHYSDLNPFTDKVCTTYVQRDHAISEIDLTAPETAELPENADFAVVYHDTVADKTLVAKLDQPKVAETNAAEELHYHIVGGCFGELENARALVAKFKQLGTNASVIDQKGSLFRVSVQSFATKKEAADALASYRDEIPGVWVLHK